MSSSPLESIELKKEEQDEEKKRGEKSQKTLRRGPQTSWAQLAISKISSSKEGHTVLMSLVSQDMDVN